jgi:O-antigen/teichoic acid export membrane protein
MGRWIRFGLTITGDRLAYYCYSVADLVVVGRLLGNNVLGIYSLSMTLASLPSEKILPMVTQVSFASYSRIQDDRRLIAENILNTIKTVSLVAWPVYFLMVAIAPEAIPLVLGEKWQSIVVPFQILCLSMPVRALAVIFPPAVFAVGRAAVNLVNMVITFVVMAIAFLVGVRFGVLGVCVAWATAYPLVFLATSWRSLSVLDVKLTELLKETSFPFGASLLTLLVLMSLRAGLVLPATIGSMIALTLLGICMFLGLVFAFQRHEYARLKGFLLG